MRFSKIVVACFCISSGSFSFAETPLQIEHHDPVIIDSKLTLSELVNLTIEKYPDMQWLQSIEQEISALKQRSESWTAGASTASLRYQEATSGTLHYLDASVQVPLWNLGQRDANNQIVIQAENDAVMQRSLVKLKVAGLLRTALWDMQLQTIRYEQAQIELSSMEKLINIIKRRVLIGDLPKTDELLAQTELLQKRSVAIQTEAEVMHARKRYSTITQTLRVPANYQESLTTIKEIEQTHPALQAVNSQIDRKQAELEALKLVGSGQSSVSIGINSDRPSNQDSRSNNTESFNIGINVPFGGEAHLAPEIAALYVEISKLRAEHDQLYRDLEQAHHEAEHNLQINKVELTLSEELKTIAEKHLQMSELSFSVGEMDLMDLLKIRAQTQLAILSAKEKAVTLQRDQAFYNQAVGVLP